MRSGVLKVAVLVGVLLLAVKDEASGIDLHWMWDNRCAECHGHSAEFARKFLRVKNGQLQGRHHVENFRLFLRNHYVSTSEADAIYEMLLAQVRTEPRFMRECGNCHGQASTFVRRTMLLQNGVLISRESKQPISRFMDDHRGLQADDIEFFVNLLTRVAGEVYRP
jgi:hypothetical protein